MSVQFFIKLHLETILNVILPDRYRLAKLRAKWGKTAEKHNSRASRYFDLTVDRPQAQYVDDKTWTDLEFPRIFSLLDTTENPLGSQLLYRKLRSYVDNPDDLAEQYSAYNTLRSNALLRERIQLKLAHLDSESNAYIVDYVFGKPPEKQKYIALLPWWSLVCLLTLVAVITFSWSIWIWLSIIAINGIIIYRLSPILNRNVEILMGCNLVLDVADSLSSLDTGSALLPELTQLAKESSQRIKVRESLGWLSTLQRPLLAYLAVWLNLIFMAELVAYSRTIDRFIHFRSALASTFELVGSLDASIAIASYLERRPDHCQPSISDSPRLQIQEGYHVLIEKPIKNSICLDGRSALITGSNMAGKTTFIKMVGINIIFGRTLGFCLASSAAFPKSSVMASIQGLHSVESGKSNYFTELEAIRSFVANAEQGGCKIFLIDELFNGTNTVERLAVARAVLESLCQNAQVLATTHDVELQTDLMHYYDLFYFQEDPDVDGYFDWQIRSGAATNRNAIRLLAREGFPSEIVDNASAYASKYADSFSRGL